MTVLGAVTAVIVRKFRSLVAEIRTLVNDATQQEKRIIAAAEAEAKQIIVEAREDVSLLKNELIDKLAAL